MKVRNVSLVASGLAVLAMCLAFASTSHAQAPKHGGTLVFTVPASDMPSMDGHQETTFAVMHAVGPHYSTLLRIDPNDPKATKIVGDAAEDKWTVSKDKKTYTFKLRKGILFSDGSKMTANDVVASFNHMINPPAGVISPRRAYFTMIESVTAPKADTVVFKLKFPSGAFLGVAAIPFNYIYKADILAKDPNYYKTHILGSGPFLLKEQNPGANWVGVRNPKYFRKGLPYLDGFEAIYTPKEVVEIQNMRSGRSMIQFRGFPPAVRDQLKGELGDKINVQESPWNCGLFAVPNSFRKPFDDIRVRQALTLALDRWGGSQAISKIAIVKTVGGFVFPGHPLSMSDDELAAKMLGYSRDLEGRRKQARQLLKDAGVPEGFKFKLTNRSTDQPYKIVGTWLIDQWRQIGLDVEQLILPTGPLFAAQRANPPQYDVTIDFNCQTIVNPQVDISQFISGDRNNSNSGHYIDRKLDGLYDAELAAGDPAEQKRLINEYELYLAQTGYYINTLWWHRIVVSSSKVHSWHISPSHYINNQLENVWLE